MLCEEMIAVCSEIGTEQISTLFGENVEFLGRVHKTEKSYY